MLGFGHPGKLGDALYCLPTIKYLCEQRNCQADFWTSEYCLPLKPLFEYQSFINKVYVSPSYVLENWGCGGQPPYVPIPNDYEVVYQLGFRRIPDKRLDWFIGESVGLSQLPEVSYEVPSEIILSSIQPYVILAARGETGFKSLFLDFIQLANQKDICVIQIGGYREFIGEPSFLNRDQTGLNLLETCGLFVNATGFVGLMSAMLVLANGWSLSKVAVHDGIHWDMRHVIKSSSNFYPVNPSVEEILKIVMEK